MTQEKAQDQTILHATGEDSPDMVEFRRRMHIELAVRELISAIGNLCAQKFYETQAINELTEELRAINESLSGIREPLDGMAGEFTTDRPLDSGRYSVANNLDAIADGLLSVINGDMGLHISGDVSVGNDNLDNLERIADNLSTQEGVSVAESLDSIRTDIGCAVDPEMDTQLQVRVDGNVVNHPY